ncbi:uncharacterized protein LOC103725904, partial [Nannospalax galili]|uniref:uncharacterized protein LOC103725904 n=1 Tax=Nannospalax galili TaxID=1026970 RepID=UPI0004ED1EA6
MRGGTFYFLLGQIPFGLYRAKSRVSTLRQVPVPQRQEPGSPVDSITCPSPGTTVNLAAFVPLLWACGRLAPRPGLNRLHRSHVGPRARREQEGGDALPQGGKSSLFPNGGKGPLRAPRTRRRPRGARLLSPHSWDHTAPWGVCGPGSAVPGTHGRGVGKRGGCWANSSRLERGKDRGRATETQPGEHTPLPALEHAVAPRGRATGVRARCPRPRSGPRHPHPAPGWHPTDPSAQPASPPPLVSSVHSRRLLRTSGSGAEKDKLKILPRQEEQEDSTKYAVLTFLSIACMLVVLLASGLAYCLRHNSHYKLKEKLSGLGGDPNADATAAYQELCRQRMAVRPPDRPEGPHTSRINSVSSQFSDGPMPSPSARSSTSSWSEEPVQSNMDISTGHMILAYMEDHLKNKNRLEKEWEALCTYQAEPSSSLIAQREENASKNRSLAVLT